MAKCQICGKHPRQGIKLSHSNVRTKRTWSPNIFRVRANIDGTNKRVYVCSRCLRSGKIKRAE